MSDPVLPPDAWKRKPALQQPAYPSAGEYEETLAKIRALPPLVSPGEVANLKSKLALAGRGQAFILQGGACAERFLDCRGEAIAAKLKILLQMSVILAYGARKPVLRIGRIAGQYAKPRSSEWETAGGVRMPSYRGDAVNSAAPDPARRAADPRRLLQSYFYSAATLNHIRALIDGGFADIRHPYAWNLRSIEKSRNWPAYKDMVERILDSINFMESVGGANSETLGRIEYYTSHEGLLLGYEDAMTRWDEERRRWMNLSAHMIWIGARTRQLDGAHVEYFRGIDNPVGVKIDGQCGPDELLALLDVLNPSNEEGRVTLIARIGAARIRQALPPLVRAVRRAGKAAVWSCDPMHGNTLALEGGRKTRDFSVILEELRESFRIHEEEGSRLAGVHFELTGEDVTECVGGAENLTSDDLDRRYESYCDPRLNGSQSLEMGFCIARMLKGESAEA